MLRSGLAIIRLTSPASLHGKRNAPVERHHNNKWILYCKTPFTILSNKTCNRKNWFFQRRLLGRPNQMGPGFLRSLLFFILGLIKFIQSFLEVLRHIIRCLREFDILTRIEISIASRLVAIKIAISDPGISVKWAFSNCRHLNHPRLDESNHPEKSKFNAKGYPLVKSNGLLRDFLKDQPLPENKKDDPSCNIYATFIKCAKCCEQSQPFDSPALMPWLAFDPSSGRGCAAERVTENDSVLVSLLTIFLHTCPIFSQQKSQRLDKNLPLFDP